MERYTPDPIHCWAERYHAKAVDQNADELRVQIIYEQDEKTRHAYELALRAADGLENYLSVQVYNRAWAMGAKRIYLGAPPMLFQQVEAAFDEGKPYAGMREMMERIYSGFQLLPLSEAANSISPDASGAESTSDPRTGSHIGVDLGGSDLKVVALKDGELCFHAKQNWNPRTFEEPDKHLEYLRHWIGEAQRQAGFKRFDGLGISTAGVVVGSEIPLSGLGAGLAPHHYDESFRCMADHLSEHFGGVPVQVMHDGDAAALWVAVDMGLTDVLGLAFGTGLGAGYVDAEGQLTGALCEIGKCIVDMAPDAPEHIYNHTRGPALHFLSQNAVFRLAPQNGIPLDTIPVRAEKLRHVQRLAVEGNGTARQIFGYIGVRLAQAVVEFRGYFGMEHVVLFGRVASGESGEWILEKANETLGNEFPECDVQVHLPTTPPGKDPAVTREFGQAIAAAYLSSARLGSCA